MSNARRRARRRRRRQQQHENADRRRVDLHMHSCFSDGIYSVAEILNHCSRGKIDVFSITDHDLVPVLAPGLVVQTSHPMWHIHGVELTAAHEDNEIHLLAYFPDHMPEDMQDFCRHITQQRAVRYDSLVRRLGLPNVAFAPPAAHEGKRAMTRLHLAKDIFRCGHSSSVGESFSRYLHHIPSNEVFLPVPEVLAKAKSNGAFTSWAHPPVVQARQWSGTFQKWGLDALEAFRPHRQKKYRKSIKEIAHCHTLHVTGGSDSHGWGGHLGSFAFLAEEIRSWADRFIGSTNSAQGENNG